MSELADDLVERLRQVLADQPATEAGLRLLSDRAQDLERALAGDLEASEARLDRLSARPDSSIAEAAALLRRVEETRVALDRVHALLENLEERARLLRTRWLSSQGGPRPAAEPAPPATRGPRSGSDTDR